MGKRRRKMWWKDKYYVHAFAQFFFRGKIGGSNMKDVTLMCECINSISRFSYTCCPSRFYQLLGNTKYAKDY